MRPSTALCLLIVALAVISISSKRIHRKGKPKEKEPAKNRESVKKPVKKEQTEESEEEDEEEDEEEMEDEEDIEEDDDSDVEEEDEEESDDEEEEEDDESEEDEDDESEEEEDDDEEEEDDDEEDDESDDEEGDDDESENITYLASEEFKGEQRDQLQEKGIFYSLKAIKQYLQGHEFEHDQEITDILRRFNITEEMVQEKLEMYHHTAMKPFYVVEGVNPETRRKVAQILARRLKGLYIVNQPRVALGPVPKIEGAKKAYYALSKYAIANKVLISLYHTPVVIESYWTEHTSFIIAKVWEKAAKLPKQGLEVYRFPEDLLLPNTTFAIFNSAPPRLGKRPSKQYLLEQRQLVVYKRFTGAKVHIIRFPESAKQIADKIDMYLHGLEHKPGHDTFEITLAE